MVKLLQSVYPPDITIEGEIMSTKEEPKQVSAARVEAVMNYVSADDAIQANPAIKDLLKNKDATIKKRGGELIKVPGVVIEIAQQLWDNKIDACTAHKAEILKAACKVFAKVQKVEASAGEQAPQAVTSISANADSKSIPCVEQAVWTLLVSAENLAEHHDKKPGFEKRVEMLKKAIKLYQEVIS